MILIGNEPSFVRINQGLDIEKNKLLVWKVNGNKSADTAFLSLVILLHLLWYMYMAIVTW